MGKAAITFQWAISCLLPVAAQGGAILDEGLLILRALVVLSATSVVTRPFVRVALARDAGLVLLVVAPSLVTALVRGGLCRETRTTRCHLVW